MTQNPVYFAQPLTVTAVPWDGDLPNLEALLAVEPDFVFGWQEVRTALAESDIPVYGFYDQNGLSTWQEGLEELRKLAALTGRSEQAETVIQQFEERLAAYKARSPMDRSVMVVGATENEFYIRTAVSGTCALIREIGQCDWADPTDGASWSYTTSAEGLLELDPDVIIVSNWGEWPDNETMLADLAQNPLWNELTAVKAGRVTPELGAYEYLQGIGPLGNMQFLDLYLPLIYPETFPAPLTDEEIEEILAEQ
jgi:iron complex transport system substrate-binding protein